MQNKTVVPDYKRKPLDTTVLYVPMLTDIAEKTWRSSFTNYSVSLQTTWWVTAWYFNWSARLLTNVSAYTNVNHTIACFVKRSWWNYSRIFTANPCWILKWDWLWRNANNKFIYECYYWSSSWNITSWTFDLSGWHCLIFSWWKLYVDNVLQWTNSWSYNWWTVYTIGWHTTWNSCTNQFMTWYIWDCVLDSAVWTDEQRAKFFNKLKTRYWIS